MANKSSKKKKIGALSIKNVTKIYDPSGVNVKAVDDCSMEIAGGEVCMIVGPSGCGKTTLLNAIAGFHSITEGSIHLDGELLCGPTKPKAEQSAERMVVFQHGVAWFSLVAAEMVSGDLGLGYLIVDAYMNNVTVPMVIAMITLGFIGYFSSACVRALGNKLMAWHVKELAQQGR